MSIINRSWVAVAVATSIALSACADADSGDDAADAAPTTTSPPTTETTAAAPPPTTEAEDGADETAPDTVPVGQLPASSQATRATRVFTFGYDEGDLEAAAGERAPALIDAGTYSTSGLGTELSFSLDGPWRLDEELDGLVRLVRDVDAEGADQRTLILARPLALMPSEATADPESLLRVASLADVPFADIDDWFASNPAAVLLDQDDTEIGGFPARRFDVTIDSAAGPTLPCGPGINCLSFAFVPALETPILGFEGRITRLWLVDQSPYEPLLVSASAAEEDFDAHVTDVQTTIDTIELGDAAPPPVDRSVAASSLTHVRAAEVELGLFGGTLLVEDELWVSQTAGFVIVADGAGPEPGQRPPSGALLRAVRSADGREFSDAADVVEWMVTADGVEAEIVGEAEVLGTTATVVDAVSDLAVAARTATLVYADVPDGVPVEAVSLPPPPAMRFWALDSDSGPLLLVAAGLSLDTIEPAIAMAETLAAGLTLP